MGIHVEWAVAKELAIEFVEPGEFEDDYGTTNDKQALLVEADSSIFAIEGTPGEIRAALYKALAIISKETK